MSRPTKIGLDYFPLDVDFLQDIKIRKLIKSQGVGSIAVYTLLLSLIYKQGYYVCYDEDLLFVVAEQTHCEEDYISQVINTCLSVGLFSKALFASCSVLTSKGIQERFQLISKLSKRKAKIEEFSLVSAEESPVNSEETPVSSEKTTQSKVKESKVKKMKTSSDDDVVDNASASPTQVTKNIDKEVDFLKGETCWLEQLQVLHKLDMCTIRDKLNDFRAQCLADGKTEHASMQDAKAHFNSWLRITLKQIRHHDTKYKRDSYEIPNGRRGIGSGTF